MRRNRHIYIPVINKLGCSRGIIAGQFLKAYWNISGNFIPPEKHQWCTLMRFCHYSAITLSFLPTSVFCMFCALFTRYQHIAVSLFSYYCFFLSCQLVVGGFLGVKGSHERDGPGNLPTSRQRAFVGYGVD